MRHNRSINHLGRKSGHRKAMLANMACSLIMHKRIETTLAKAKALRMYVEPLITKSKDDSTHSRRTVFSYLKQKEAVSELFRVVAPKIADRPGAEHHNVGILIVARTLDGADANGHSQGRLDMFNNVCYNWNSRTTDGGAMRMQFVNNYYKMGPDTRQTILFSADNETGGDRDQFAYVSGNIRENKNGTLTGDALNVTYRATGLQPDRAFYNEPFFPSYAKIESAQEAYRSVLSDVGANQPLSDITDQRILSETLNGSYTYTGSKSGIRGEIDDEMDANGFEDYPETEWPSDYDSDNDGLPNWWEELRGTNPRSRTLNYADTNRDTESDGYTELERYLDFMAHPHLWLAPGQEASIDVATLFRGYSNSPQYLVEESAWSGSVAFKDAATLVVKAGDKAELTEVILSVQDAEYAQFTRRLCIAVTRNSHVASIAQTPVAPASPHVYTLQGVRVAQPAKGVYISDGKKMIVR